MKKFRTENFYYVDKTKIIKDLLDNWGEVNLFTRPRRFGKTLSMSMLKAFFEIGCKKELFEGLEIWEEAENCQKYMGQFPVISISLKGVKGDDYSTARSMMASAIGMEAMRFRFLMESIKTLSVLLQKHFGKKVLLLIDEYNVPLAKANEGGYYERLVSLIRNLFEQALKTNDSLYFAVLTGCLRVAKESIFTGLNNPKVLSITNVKFGEYFGFTDREVREILSYYGLSERYGTVKDWYDGYRFGNVDVYCPWDVVRHFIERVGDGLTKREVENLIAGEVVTKEIHQELTYNRLYDSIENMWSVLFTTGYLTQRGKPDGDMFQLAIPNREIRKIFTDEVMGAFKEKAKNDGNTLCSFCEALKNGDAEQVIRNWAKEIKES